MVLAGTKTTSNAILERSLDSASTQLQLAKQGALLVNGAVRLRVLDGDVVDRGEGELTLEQPLQPQPLRLLPLGLGLGLGLGSRR